MRRNCTELSDFFRFSNLFLKNFLKRNYKFNDICKISNMVANLNRNDLLKYKVKNRISFDESIFSYFHFDLNLVNLY